MRLQNPQSSGSPFVKCNASTTMFPQFSSSSSYPHTDASHMQPMHASVFPVVEFSEAPMETPLDLNFSQRGPQNTQRVQYEADNGIQPQKLEMNTSLQQQGLGIRLEDVATSIDGGNVSVVDARLSKTTGDDVETPPSKTRASGGTAGSTTPQKSGNDWTHSESLALFDAKKAQAEKAESGPRKLRSSTLGKWEEIAESCRALGINKSASQCREKWERLWPAFRTILDWEIKVSERKSSYWTMTEEERVLGGFPSLFDRDVYDAMSARFAFVTSLNPASPILNSLNVDSVTTSFKEPGASADGSKELGQNGIAAGEDGQAIVEHRTSGRKRKTAERASVTKQSPSENNKKVTILIDPKEEAVGIAPSPAKEPRMSKSKSPLDITERRLLLEERKMKLAEQRFSLEEKKLEATIEIGKGLIASMERMTGTISGLGPTPAQQQR